MPNHLSKETSPYLQQHANNPVDWYPWNQEALDRAKREKKPILLSIGYAACHWCHVMAHESFENNDTAKIMNELFVNIKVDREERPDLDKIYQTAHNLLTQRNGGWPLTIFLTPDDLTPFFSGTYFPAEARYQLPAFTQVLQSISDIYHKHPTEINEQNQQLKNFLNHPHTTSTDIELTEQPVKLAFQMLKKSYDKLNGGFGGAPKFPNPSRIEFLMEEKSSLADSTLQHIANGGIYDQIQGGFFRYSVDEKWRIPHFEKMLYDNAQLLSLYALAAKEFNNAYFAEIAHETADWIVTKMQSPEGGYYSSLDADSEGHEGKFYVWNKSEIQTLLTEKEYQFAESFFGLSEAPNFENNWHLFVATPSEVNHAILKNIKQKLLTVRDQRIAPSYDKKILTSWNSLMIKGMAIAGEILHEPRYIASAERALELIQHKLWVDNHLLVSYKDDKAHLSAYLDDYAFLLDALLTLLQIKWNSDYLTFAIQLADSLLKNFEDSKTGGFYFTAENHEKLLYRPKTMMDEAIPSGNAIAAKALLTLGHLIGETRYIFAAEKTLIAAWPALLQYPAEHCSMLLVLKNFLEPPKTIIIRGSVDEMQPWAAFCKQKNMRDEVFSIPDTESNLPGALGLRKSTGKICAYVCHGMHCSTVMTSLNELE